MKIIIFGKNHRYGKGNEMNIKRVFLKITIVLSIVPIIFGILMVIFSDSIDGKTKGLTMAVIAPVVIWGIYGAAYFPFKGIFNN